MLMSDNTVLGNLKILVVLVRIFLNARLVLCVYKFRKIFYFSGYTNRTVMVDSSLNRE
jgi:hypothetical protein